MTYYSIITKSLFFTKFYDFDILFQFFHVRLKIKLIGKACKNWKLDDQKCNIPFNY